MVNNYSCKSERRPKEEMRAFINRFKDFKDQGHPLIKGNDEMNIDLYLDKYLAIVPGECGLGPNFTNWRHRVYFQMGLCFAMCMLFYRPLPTLITLFIYQHAHGVYWMMNHAWHHSLLLEFDKFDLDDEKWAEAMADDNGWFNGRRNMVVRYGAVLHHEFPLNNDLNEDLLNEDLAQYRVDTDWLQQPLVPGGLGVELAFLTLGGAAFSYFGFEWWLPLALVTMERWISTGPSSIHTLAHWKESLDFANEFDVTERTLAFCWWMLTPAFGLRRHALHHKEHGYAVHHEMMDGVYFPGAVWLCEHLFWYWPVWFFYAKRTQPVSETRWSDPSTYPITNFYNYAMHIFPYCRAISFAVCAYLYCVTFAVAPAAPAMCPAM